MDADTGTVRVDDLIRGVTPPRWRWLPRWLRRSDYDWYVVIACLRTIVSNRDETDDGWSEDHTIIPEIAGCVGPWPDPAFAYTVADMLRDRLTAEGLDLSVQVTRGPAGVR